MGEPTTEMPFPRQAKQARVITGDIFGRHDVTDQVADIRLLLAPLALETPGP